MRDGAVTVLHAGRKLGLGLKECRICLRRNGELLNGRRRDYFSVEVRMPTVSGER